MQVTGTNATNATRNATNATVNATVIAEVRMMLPSLPTVNAPAPLGPVPTTRPPLKPAVVTGWATVVDNDFVSDRQGRLPARACWLCTRLCGAVAWPGAQHATAAARARHAAEGAGLLAAHQLPMRQCACR
jgi:hypothetical protein